MPPHNPVLTALRNAETGYKRFDRHRDRDILRRTVLQLHTAGHTSQEIANHVGIERKQIKRITDGNVDNSHKPAPVNQPDMSQQHCNYLEHTADIALDMACRLRDEDPQIVWDTLSNLNRGALQELAVIALAAMPTDQPKRQIFAWVYQIGEQL